MSRQPCGFLSILAKLARRNCTFTACACLLLIFQALWSIGGVKSVFSDFHARYWNTRYLSSPGYILSEIRKSHFRYVWQRSYLQSRYLISSACRSYAFHSVCLFRHLKCHKVCSDKNFPFVRLPRTEKHIYKFLKVKWAKNSRLNLIKRLRPLLHRS